MPTFRVRNAPPRLRYHIPVTLSPSEPPPLGEIIAAATTYFTAECTAASRTETIGDLPDPPAFGSFVRVGAVPSANAGGFDADFDPFESPGARTTAAPIQPGEAVTLYGVVCYAANESIEPGRPVTAFGLSEDDLRDSQPQIFELLATRFSALLIGHAGADGSMRMYLPPRPARLHARVWSATVEETRQLTAKLDYLRGFLSGAAAGAGIAYPPDELVAALLRHASATAYPGDAAFLLRAGRELAGLLPTEYDRLRALIGRVMG